MQKVSSFLYTRGSVRLLFSTFGDKIRTMKQRGIIVAGGLCLVVMLVCLIPGLLSAAEPVDAAWCEKQFIEGVRAYGLLDYRNAENLLEKTATACVDNGDVPPHTQANILEQLAFTKVATGKHREAEDAFRRLLMIAPDHSLDEQRVSPKIVSIFKKVRGRMERSGMLRRVRENAQKKDPDPPQPVDKPMESPQPAPDSTVKTTPPQPPKALPRYDLSFKTGAMLLFGKDMSAFGGGILMGVGADFRLVAGLYVGAGVSYVIHPTSSLQSEAKLHQMYGEFSTGYLFDLDAVRLKTGVKLGFGGYGLNGLNDHGAVELGILTGLDVPLPYNIVLGLVVEYDHIINFDGDSSSMAAIALRAGYQW